MELCAMSYERKALAWMSLFALFLAFVWLLGGILLPFVVGLIIAYLLDPVADRLCRAGCSRTIATILITVTLVIVVLFLVLFLVPLVASEVRDMIRAIPEQLEVIRGALEDLARRWAGDRFPAFQDVLKRAVANWSNDWTVYASGVLKSLWSGSLALVNFLSLFLVTPVVTFYLLLDWDRMVSRVDSWLPRDNAPAIRRLVREMNQVVSGFLRGQGTVGLVLGALYAAALTVVGLRYGLIIGLTAGLLSFIPFVGSIVGLLLSLGVAISQFWPNWVPIMTVVAIFLAGQAIEGNILQPKIVGDRIRLHPVWIMFALFAFTYLFGVVGALIAVPIAAVIGVLARFSINEYRKSTLYRPDPEPVGESAPITGDDRSART